MTTKPDYAIWNPPFVYNPVECSVDDAKGQTVFDLCIWKKHDDLDTLGNRIAELLNADAQEGNK